MVICLFPWQVVRALSPRAAERTPTAQRNEIRDSTRRFASAASHFGTTQRVLATQPGRPLRVRHDPSVMPWPPRERKQVPREGSRTVCMASPNGDAEKWADVAIFFLVLAFKVSRYQVSNKTLRHFIALLGQPLLECRLG